MRAREAHHRAAQRSVGGGLVRRPLAAFAVGRSARLPVASPPSTTVLGPCKSNSQVENHAVRPFHGGGGPLYVQHRRSHLARANALGCVLMGHGGGKGLSLRSSSFRVRGGCLDGRFDCAHSHFNARHRRRRGGVLPSPRASRGELAELRALHLHTRRHTTITTTTNNNGFTTGWSQQRTSQQEFNRGGDGGGVAGGATRLLLLPASASRRRRAAACARCRRQPPAHLHTPILLLLLVLLLLLLLPLPPP